MRQLRISQSITNRNTDSLEKYLNDIGKIDLLDIDEEIRLATVIQEGDRAALDKLVNANLRFVVSVAKKYQDKGLRLADLISEGNVGLIKAATRYDHTKGFKFISFAVWWIRQSIICAIAEQKRLVRLPGNQIVGITKINKAAEALEQQLERNPSLGEIAEMLELPEDKVADFHSNSSLSHSLDMLINEESGFTLMDTIASESEPNADHQLLQESLTDDLRRFLQVLPEREQKIISLYYGLYGYSETTLDDMVYIFDLSKERIRQLKDKALKTLRRHAKSCYMTGYFGQLSSS